MAKKEERKPEERKVDSYKVLRDCIEEFLPRIKACHPCMAADEKNEFSTALEQLDWRLATLVLGNWNLSREKRKVIRANIHNVKIGAETRAHLIGIMQDSRNELNVEIIACEKAEMEDKRKEVFFSILDKLISENKEAIYEAFKGIFE